jgi:hypothetical protein
VFVQPKLDYNRLHPYTSWIPILCWIVVSGYDTEAIRVACPTTPAGAGWRKVEAVGSHSLDTSCLTMGRLLVGAQPDASAAELQPVAVRLAGLHHAGDVHRPVPHLAAHRLVQQATCLCPHARQLPLPWALYCIGQWCFRHRMGSAVRPPTQSCASASAAGVPNGQPKLLLNLFLPGYPLVNFALCTAVYVFVSYRLFFLTNALKNVAIPGKEMGLLWRNGAIMAVAAAVSIPFTCCNTSRCDPRSDM